MNLLQEKIIKYDTKKRVSKQAINKDYKALKEIEPIQQVLQALPYYTLILNEYRQIIISNEKFLNDHVQTQVNLLFGKRPGEVFQCEHFNEGSEGCGTSENCQYCGILNTIRESQIKNKIITNNCRITSKKSNILTSYDFSVKCVPLKINDQIFYFLTLVDISHENRKNAIEKIFFHDVINLVGSIRGITSVLKSINNFGEISEYLEILSNMTEQLSEEIISQRDLSAAENKNLIVNKKEINSFEIINAIIDNTMFIENTRKCKVILAPDSTGFLFQTDPVLLKRILINMVKNALEASHPNSCIIIGCNKKNSNAHFYVHNDNYIPEEFQKQIFQRSFSTKEANRGLGTYSMRLIGENYLHGKVYFTSDKLKGTTFSIDLPVN